MLVHSPHFSGQYLLLEFTLKFHENYKKHLMGCNNTLHYSRSVVSRSHRLNDQNWCFCALLRTHWRNGLKFGMLMYHDHPENLRLDFCHGLSILLIFGEFLLRWAKFGVSVHSQENTWKGWPQISMLMYPAPLSELTQDLGQGLLIFLIFIVFAVWHCAYLTGFWQLGKGYRSYQIPRSVDLLVALHLCKVGTQW